MNKVFLVGNLTRDPELGTTNSGIAYCRFSVAINRSFAGSNGEKETDFFNCVTWRGLAENCNRFLKKGSKVAIAGRIQNDNYEDKDGNKRTSVQIVCDDVEFLSSRSSDEGGGVNNSYEKKGGGAPKKAAVDQLEIADDDLPF